MAFKVCCLFFLLTGWSVEKKTLSSLSKIKLIDFDIDLKNGAL